MITIDANELIKLRDGLAKYRNAIPQSLAKKALREAVKPMLDRSKQLVPVGVVKGGTGDKRRGGATRRDLRIRFVRIEGEEIARVLVGVSQKSGKVGWRTHFITKGFTDLGGKQHAGKDFLEQAYNSTITQVQNQFYKSLFDGFIRWSNDNLPK